ncbi:MAG: NAD-dependent epimerase/dehydratase family protein [Legionellaceae bacterium]|nr:NAD-dependent epimerase/dehydratase family protein [Legionellaceae bacterium]
MHAVIVGYGYSGFFLAQELIRAKLQGIALSRHYDPLLSVDGMPHLSIDIGQTPLPSDLEDIVLYYFVPPPATGQSDTLLTRFLQQLVPQQLQRVIYCSSSGVYGDHQGAWIDETAKLEICHDRQRRRRHAEQSWQHFCEQHDIPLVILRTAGIYGPGRIPLTACAQQNPVLSPHEAPFINHIYVHDLARVATCFARHSAPSGFFNLADGKPAPMGQMQQKLAALLHYPAAAEQSFATVWEQASPMKREFMQANKRLCIRKLCAALPDFTPTELETALHQSLQKEWSL